MLYLFTICLPVFIVLIGLIILDDEYCFASLSVSNIFFILLGLDILAVICCLSVAIVTYCEAPDEDEFDYVQFDGKTLQYSKTPTEFTFFELKRNSAWDFSHKTVTEYYLCKNGERILYTKDLYEVKEYFKAKEGVIFSLEE